MRKMVRVLVVGLLLSAGVAWAHHDEGDEGDDDDHEHEVCTSTGNRTTVTCGDNTVVVVDNDQVCPAVNCSCTLSENHICGKLRARVCKTFGFRPGCQRCQALP